MKYIIFFLLIQNAWSSPRQLAKAYKLYKMGDYPQAQKVLHKLKRTPSFRKLSYYWLGLSYKKMLKYDEAIKFMELANKYKKVPQDMYYELGQSYYAANELELAMKNFNRSISKKYMVASSLYYSGHISQLLGESPKALSYFNKIKNYKKSTNDIRQAASFQTADIYLAQAEKTVKPALIVSEKVLPQLREAAMIDLSSPMVKDIEKKADEIKKKYDLAENILRNGRKVGKHPFLIRFTETVQYDSNVIFEADETTIKATHRDSGLFKSAFFMKNRYNWKRRVLVTPQLSIDNDFHTRRGEKTIYSNDLLSFTPSLKTSLEHVLFGKEASFMIDVDYKHTLKDENQNKGLVLQSRTVTYSVGEKFEYFKLGSSSVKYKRKQYDARTVSSDSYTDTLALSQTIKLPQSKILMLSTNFDFNYSITNVTNSTNAYLIRADYIWPNFYKSYKFTGGMNFTITDTKHQSSTRGTEKSYNPFIKFSKKFFNLVDVTLSYEFTKNSSKDKGSQDYTRHVTALAFQFQGNKIPFVNTLNF